MLLNLIRWFKGYVCFVIIGKFPERFINIITTADMPIWGTQRKGTTIIAQMYASDYRDIRYYAKKCRVRLKITSKHGMPFYIKKYKNRIGVLIGVLVFVSIIFVMSSFIWSVDVVGLQTISYHKVISVLEDNGLYIGTFKPSVSYYDISRDTMLSIDEIGWMSINVSGTHASVEIKEKAMSPTVDDYTKPCNVKAKCDGIIKSIDTLSGVAYFSPGSAVVKDQMIVSGVVEDSLGGVDLVRANARVTAYTTHKMSFCIDKSIEKIGFSVPSTRKTLKLLWFELPLPKQFVVDSENAHRYTTSYVTLFDSDLPIGVTTDSIYQKSVSVKTIDSKNAEKILNTRSALYEYFNLSDCIVKSRKYDFSSADSGYMLNVTYNCEQDIAKQEEIIADDIDIVRKTAEEKHDQLIKSVQ